MRTIRNGSFGALAMLALAFLATGCDASSSDTGDATGEGTSAVTVAVEHGGQAVDADLSDLAVVQVGGLDFVRLSDVVKEAFPDLDLGTVTADFAASDGFMPGSKSNCTGLVPVQGGLLVQGYISPATRNLAWDEALQYPGCLRVSDTARILLADR